MWIENALDIKMTRTRAEEGDGVVPALVANIPIRESEK